MTVTNQNFINPEYKSVVYTACAATALAGGSLLAPWESARIVGATTLMGIFYGVIHNMFACRECIEYFTVGHVWDGENLDKRPVMTLNPNINAVAWGMIDFWQVSAFAGIVFAAISRLPYTAVTLTLRRIAPTLTLGTIIISVTTQFFAWKIESFVKRREFKGELHEKFKDVPWGYQAKFSSINLQNSVAFRSLASVVAIISLGILTTRLGLTPNGFKAINSQLGLGT